MKSVLEGVAGGFSSAASTANDRQQSSVDEALNRPRCCNGPRNSMRVLSTSARSWDTSVLLSLFVVLMSKLPSVITQAALNGTIREWDLLWSFRMNITDTRFALDSWRWDNFSGPCVLYEDVSYDRYEVRGVTCTTDSKHVTALDLHGLSLEGEAHVIGTLVQSDGLRSLDVLDLSDNRFSGPMPENWSSLTALRLNRNVLNGTLPQLPSNLESLFLQNNLLSGDLKRLSFLQDLRELDLHGNEFSGSLSDHWNYSAKGKFKLAIVDLSHNMLEGEVPSHLVCTGSDYVSYLNMSFNKFDGEIPINSSLCGGDAWETEIVDLSSNRLQGDLPPLLLDRPYFQHFNCSNNKLSGSIQWALEKRGSVRSVDLSNNQFTSMKGSLSIYPNLEVLNLQNNQINGTLDFLLSANLPNLRELRLAHNKFTTGANLDQVLRFSQLEVLDLSFNELKGTFPHGFQRMPKLRELRLQSNLLNGELKLGAVAAKLSGSNNLEVLDLRNNNLSYSTWDLVTIFTNCPNLRELRLGGNRHGGVVQIQTGAFSAKLVSLEVLDLSNSNLEESISLLFKSVSKMSFLRYLDLSSNSLHGELKSMDDYKDDFSKSNLTYFNVSFNRGVYGPIPVTLDYLRIPLANYASFFNGTKVCGGYLGVACEKPSSSLHNWQIALISLGCVIAPAVSCLGLGFEWRRRIEAHQRKQDSQLIETLLDKDTAVIMPLRDLKKATENFSERLQIGQGGFGTVYKGKLESGTLVAVKRSMRDSKAPGTFQFLNEVTILSQVHHRNLVRLLGCCLTRKIALLVFEYIPNGTLQEHLLRQRGDNLLTWRQRLQIAVQTSEALDYLHSSASPPIYHLDVKSANILLDENLNAKVADFGISKLVPALDITHVTAVGDLIGTPGYMDPEALSRSKFSGKSDVYAMGVILLELISGQSAVDRNREEAYLVARAGPVLDSGRLEDFVDPVILETFMSAKGKESIVNIAKLAGKCLNLESRRRPTMKELVGSLQAIWRWQFEVVPVNIDDDDAYVNSVNDIETSWNFAGLRKMGEIQGVELAHTC